MPRPAGLKMCTGPLRNRTPCNASATSRRVLVVIRAPGACSPYGVSVVVLPCRGPPIRIVVSSIDAHTLCPHQPHPRTATRTPNPVAANRRRAHRDNRGHVSGRNHAPCRRNAFGDAISATSSRVATPPDR